jgi:hypothetical protein
MVIAYICIVYWVCWLGVIRSYMNRYWLMVCAGTNYIKIVVRV